MATEKNCAWTVCGEKFTPSHGNNKYCRDEHEYEAKKERQKKDRDPTSRFLPILRNNHRIIAELFIAGKTELTRAEIEGYRLDISLCRHLKPSQQHIGMRMLDFGDYYMTTESDFLNFKIYKNDATITV